MNIAYIYRASYLKTKQLQCTKKKEKKKKGTTKQKQQKHVYNQLVTIHLSKLHPPGLSSYFPRSASTIYFSHALANAGRFNSFNL